MGVAAAPSTDETSTGTWIMCKLSTIPCYYTGYFVQWFKILVSCVYVACQPVWQLVLFLSASPSKDPPVFLSDSSPPSYILIFSLVSFPSRQLPSPSIFSVLWHCSNSLTPPFASHYFLTPPSYAPFPSLYASCKASSCSSFVSPFLSIHFTDCHSLPLAFAFLCFVCFCILSLLLKPYYMYFIFLQVFLPFTTSVSSFSSSFTSSHTFSFLCNMQHLLSSFYIHPRNEWVTWICLFAL